MQGAIISALATVFRKLKVALPFSSDGHRLVYANSQTALFTLLHFLNIHIFIAQYNIAKIPITYGTNFSKTRICKLYVGAIDSNENNPSIQKKNIEYTNIIFRRNFNIVFTAFILFQITM